ncbi:hypothetical protein [Tenacibaculum maritimum]|uniref:hypothetical protein n=1 Tax=Tenacibaculum maritimum TaxID=107401 RepID=UPI0012E40FCD|nr:hypothetical protein [Tenacibaculum maritimum]CAA0259840.1 hypothetical protein TMP227_90085 [Tenacibaculum maritimum]
MKDKLAILIVGHQNSGKTTTIKYFDKVYDENETLKRYCRVGWRHLQLFKGKLYAIFSLIYFIPASPTETQKPLKKRLGKMLPELLLMAEQKNGKEYNNTIEFLNENNYKIIEFYTKDNSNEIWKEWNNKTFEDLMNKRATAIGNEFREFIINRIK